MTKWESIVAAGKANSAWNSHPRAGSVQVLDGRPIQVCGCTPTPNPVKGRRSWSVVTFRYLDGAAEIGQMPAARFNVVVQREYRRLSQVVTP